MRILESYPSDSVGESVDKCKQLEKIIDADTLLCFHQFLTHLRREHKFFSRLVIAQNSEPGVNYSINLRAESQIGQVICQIIQGETNLDHLAKECCADKALLESVIVLWIQMKKQVNKELFGQMVRLRNKKKLSSDEAA